MYVLYTIGFLLVGLTLLPGLLWRCRRGATYHRDLHERFGAVALPAAVTSAPQGCLWFHAASVGEIQGLQPIIAALHTTCPELPVLVSTFTPTGKTMAQRLVPEAAAIFLLPLDVPWIMQRLVRRLRCRAFIVQETELWPNLFQVLAQRHVPIIVVNGRLSLRAMQRYTWIRPWIRRTLAHVSVFLVQSQEMAQRFCQLGAPSHCLQVAGNTNIDRALLAALQPLPSPPLTACVEGRRLLVCGSTRDGEEAMLLSVYGQLVTQHPDLLLVLAPRHLERVDAVIRLVQARRYPVLRRSQCDPTTTLPCPAVIVLDTMGELATLYSLCTLAFVGGSLVPIGGHNILEPAVFAKPVFFGPYMHHFPDLARLLCEARGAMQVQNAQELSERMAYLLEYPAEGHATGQRALAALAANRGALERVTRVVTGILQQPFSPPPVVSATGCERL